MKTYKELVEELSEKKTMSVAQRIKQGQRMKKLAKSSSFQRKKQKKMLRIAKPEEIQKKALKMAKMKVIEKFANMTKQEYQALSPQARMKVDERVVAKKGPMIQKLAKKLFKTIKQQEVERVKKMKSSTKEETNPCWDGYKQVGMKTNSDGVRVPNCVPEGS